MNLIYISGPLSTGDSIVNTHQAIAVAEELANKGYAVAVPHLSIFWAYLHPQHDYEFWMRQDFAVVDHCDAVLRMPGRSPGGDREVEYAISRGIFVGYSVEEIVCHFTIPEHEETV